MENEFKKEKAIREARIHLIRIFGPSSHIASATHDEYLEAQRRGFIHGNNVIVKKMNPLQSFFAKSRAVLKNDVWSGKPPFRFIEIGHRVCA